ncbi:hypothetical protein I350_00044 [Cryptococcus amylolentus CBS 6273]|uniref:Uncharacterized protein n=1 Tax=Cryptococcus amylolentus CBS 6273 TaxID=1296118 RepID=A0A1E3KDV8_9TREE|nr:hypothetical protein I350_00044 [Cryptococcus amylolentus CBS 6273]
MSSPEERRSPTADSSTAVPSAISDDTEMTMVANQVANELAELAANTNFNAQISGLTREYRDRLVDDILEKQLSRYGLDRTVEVEWRRGVTFEDGEGTAAATEGGAEGASSTPRGSWTGRSEANPWRDAMSIHHQSSPRSYYADSHGRFSVNDDTFANIDVAGMAELTNELAALASETSHFADVSRLSQHENDRFVDEVLQKGFCSHGLERMVEMEWQRGVAFLR